MNEINKSAKEMWTSFIAENPSYRSRIFPTVEYFCDNKKDADECGALIYNGIKTATCSAFLAYKIDNNPIPKKGHLSIVTNFDGEALCIIETTDVALRKFSEVDADFARKEGEGDLSLTYWQKVHKAFFKRAFAPHGLVPNEDLLLVCEEFRRIY